MRYAVRFIQAMAAAVILAACTEPIEFDTRNAKPLLAVYGEIDDVYSPKRVLITRSSTTLNGEAMYINDAQVMLETSDGEVYDMAKVDNMSGTYTTKKSLAAKPGIVYTLRVRVDLYEDGNMEEYVIATAPVPERVDFEKIEVALTPFMDLLEGYTIQMWGNEPAGPNYYLFKTSINGTLKTVNIVDYNLFDDAFIDGTYIDKMGMGVHISRKTINILKANNKLTPDMEQQFEEMGIISPGDNVELTISNISKGYYNYISQVRSNRGSSNPIFGGPPANIITNVPGGAGYFGAYTTSTLSVIVPGSN